MDKSNKLIAEFMGVKKCERCKDCGAYQYSKTMIYYPKDMRYNRSWNWLKPVIDKIGTIEVGYEPLSNVSLYSNIEIVYQAVVEFITVYMDHYDSKN